MTEWRSCQRFFLLILQNIYLQLGILRKTESLKKNEEKLSLKLKILNRVGFLVYFLNEKLRNF